MSGRTDVSGRTVIVGGGRMGSALAGGLLAKGALDPSQLVLVEKLDKARAELAAAFPGVEVVTDVPAGESAILAVKPHDAATACEALRGFEFQRVLSIAAGVTLSQLEEWLPPRTAVLRAMPNTPALLGQGATALAGGGSAGPGDLAWAEAVLGAVGIVVRLPERLLDAVTGLSGSGPAYIFLIAEALIDAGVLQGIDVETSRQLVVQTLLGSARMMAESGQPIRALRDAVTSPGGTTASGLRALEQHAVRSALIDAVDAATRRAHELGST